MKEFQTSQIRNVIFGGHGGTGKTTLVEALLFNLKEISRMGNVEQGSTVSDYNEDEVSRQISLNSTLAHGIWKDTKLNIIDTPGYSDFLAKLLAACALQIQLLL